MMYRDIINVLEYNGVSTIFFIGGEEIEDKETAMRDGLYNWMMEYTSPGIATQQTFVIPNLKSLDNFWGNA